MQLPFAPQRELSTRKVTAYLLDESHAVGAAKARFFKAFGFSAGAPDELITALLDHPVRNDVADVLVGPFGVKYVVRCTLQAPDGRDPCIVTVWIVEDDRRPRFVTAYPA